MRILVADDEPVTRHVLTRILEKDGHEVTSAADGREAWARFQEDRFRIVISDWMMPEMDGLELVERIRAYPSDDYTFVLLLTTKGAKEDLVAGMEAGADDFLTKPFDQDELSARLRAGQRIVALQRNLSERNAELAAANRRMKEDLIAAARIQQSLLPTDTPQFANVEFAWRFRPCDELAGDILNVFPLGAGHAGFYLLDVSGHGVPAALMSVTLSRVLVASPTQSTLLTTRATGGTGRTLVPPAVVAKRLNHRFATGATTGQFFTLLYGILDLATREIHYVSAGHPGPVLLGRKAGPVVLDATGPPIGIVDGVKYEQRSVQLDPADRLFVYSDGLTEARNEAGEQYGVERLVGYLEGRAGSPLPEVLPGLLDSVQAWSGQPSLEDDASCLAVEARAAS